MAEPNNNKNLVGQSSGEEDLEKLAKATSDHEEKALGKEATDTPHTHDEDGLLAEKEQQSLEKEDGQAATDKVLADIRRQDAETELVKEKANQEKTKTEIMDWIARKTFSFMSAWCWFVAIMFFMYFGTKQDQIEKEVIITLLTTTTVSVIGLVGFIVQGLFKTTKDEQLKKSNK
ncbi:hypothetical protein [Vibrio sp. 10N.261.46.A3]|uniref:hypothetical protein n=1 Tax=Vibrio sp. 10N.261.46.A3 TaxID=3229658 RepID=UPI00354ECCC8